MKYPIAPLNFDKDFAGFVDLSRAVYGAKAVVDEELFRWLFLKNLYNPHGQHLLHIAKDGNKVVASDCLLPVPLTLKGHKFVAAWSIKTMTHPDYQRQGIFRAMTQFNVARARDLGIDLILGFANANSFPGYKKFGWHVLSERVAVVRPLDIASKVAAKPVLRPVSRLLNYCYRCFDTMRRQRLKKLASLYEFKLLAAIPRRVAEDLWAQQAGSYPVLVTRDYNYVHWRYNQRPRHDYRFLLATRGGAPQGLVVYRFRAAKNSCIVVDYLGEPEETCVAALFGKLMEDCLANNICYIVSSSGMTFDNLLTQTADFNQRFAAPLENNMFIACLLNPDIHIADLKQAHWYYSYGDSELDIDLQPR